MDMNALKYDTSGTLKWLGIYSGLGQDTPTGIDVDQVGNVYITGTYAEGSSPNDAFTTTRFDSSGTLCWSRLYTLGYSNWDKPGDIVVDSTGFVYVAGESSDSLGNSDMVTIKYDSLGNELWISRLDTSINFWNFGVELSVDPIGNLYVSATTHTGVNWNYNLTTVKYGFSTSIEELKPPVEISFYPNPFDGNININSLQDLSNSRFILYDIAMREVFKIEISTNQQIEIPRVRIKSGIYFYKLMKNSSLLKTGTLIAK